jgi:hypothetical protein
MLQHVSRSTGRSALVATLIAASALVMADDKPSTTQERKDSNPGKTSGVIPRAGVNEAFRFPGDCGKRMALKS